MAEAKAIALPELRAVQQMYDLLKPFNSDERERVFRITQTFFGAGQFVGGHRVREQVAVITQRKASAA